MAIASADPPQRIARRRVRFQGCSLNPRESGIPLAVNATIARANGRHRWWLTLEIALIGFAVLSFAVVAWDVTVGGFHVSVAGIRISSIEPYKPFRNGVLCAVMALWLHDRTSARASWMTLTRWSAGIATVAAVASAGIAIAYANRAAGGSDTFGYVSQAQLWASGRLLWRDPYFNLARTFGRAVAPLGYDLARTPGAIVPTYPPGLPIAMAIALRLGGDAAVYYVVPLLGALAVWLTYTFGRRVADDRTGMIAAILFAFSPIVLFQSIEPMSDVPVTAFWLLALVFALAPGRLPAFAAGLGSGAAVLTRPNLIPLGVVVLYVIATQPGRLSRASLFICGLAPACGAVAVLDAIWYGSPLRSGYGSITHLYEWNNAVPNVRNYGSWLLETESPIVLLSIAAPLVARVKHVAALSAFVAVVALSYIFYAVFDNWTFLRFLLPALPLLFILTSAVIVSGIERLPLAMRGAAVFLVCVLLPSWYLVKSAALNVFDIGRAERRYVAVGEFVRDRLPPNAVVITVIHSGSLWLYGHRPTLRWDYLEPAQLEPAIDIVRARGYAPYILLEHWEEELFRARFAGVSPIGQVWWPPAVEYLGLSNVRVYSVDDRSRYFAGARILPAVVPLRP